eukprot:gene6300-4522_t
MKILQSFRKEDGTRVFLLGGNRAVLVIANNEVSRLALPESPEGDSSVAFVTNVCVAEGNNAVFATFDDKSVAKWDLTTKQFVGKANLKKKANALARGTVQGQDIIIVGDKAGDLWGFQSTQMQSLGYLGGHPVTIVTDVLVNEENTLFASCDRDEKVKLSSFPIMEEVQGYLLNHKSVVTSIGFIDPAGKYLVSAGWDHKVILWNTNTFAVLDEYSFKGTESSESTNAQEAASSEPAAPVDDAEDGEKERDYNEASAGNYPFKITVSANGTVVVLSKNEKKVTILKATTSDDNSSLEFAGSFTTDVQPVDAVFISETEVAVSLPHPYYIRVFDVAGEPRDVTENVFSEAVTIALQSQLGDSFSAANLFKSLGFEDDKNLMRDTLDNRLRELPKGGHQNKKARR